MTNWSEVYDNEDMNIISKFDDVTKINNAVRCVMLANTYFQMQKYDKMEKFCKLSMKTDGGHDVSMHILGRYYKNVKYDIPKMKLYYNISISRGYTNAMNDMAYYCGYEENDFSNLKKYYGMAVEKGDTFAMMQLAQYYHEKENNPLESKKYVLLAIQHGYIQGIINILAFFINNEVPFDKETFDQILPHVELVVKDEKVKLFIIKNCIVFGIQTKKFDVEITKNVETDECYVCTEMKSDFVVPSCGHKICCECFIKQIYMTNTKCFCSKQFVTIGRAHV